MTKSHGQLSLPRLLTYSSIRDTLAHFHFGWGIPPSPEDIRSKLSPIFRWTWAAEPTEGNYNYSLIDETIAQAKAKGETPVPIRTDFQAGSPSWLLKKGIASVTVDGGVFRL